MNLTSIESHYWEKSMKNFGIFDYVVFTFMLVACSAVGLYYAIRGRKVADAESEFLMGGRNMNTFPIAMSLVARYL